ncbi:SsgA family sporulation/cell division regulator [Streptomyces monticola]|uniref:SsgA family sporulation/cell division regulator n=1 Tax=Streptomyces monticola TaxID=2666263 RepID=A0ABW2JV13_9ACTN
MELEIVHVVEGALEDGEGRNVPLSVRLDYRAAAPYAVEFELFAYDMSLIWTVGRDLLIDGLNSVSGHGDVVVWPALDGRHDRVVLCLRNGSRSGFFSLSRYDLDVFLRQTLDMVPAGCEGGGTDLERKLTDWLADD